MAVVKKHILANLQMLDKEYNEALLSANPNRAIFFSKLGVIEYCGWLEQTMDAIIRSYAKNRIKTRNFRDSIESKIENTSGFQYKRHFRPLLIYVIGAIRCERIHEELDKCGDLASLTSELEKYLGHRNDAAHTHISTTLPRYPSPSVTIGSLKIIYPILRKINGLRLDSRYI